jgi:4'-phosphopantetheinyl transferase
VQSYRDGRVLVDWAETAVAEPLVRSLVTALTGRDPGPLHHACPSCGSIEHGRPYVDAPVAVSVAHVRGLTVVAVSDTGPVGVDVEPDGDPAWTRREATVKALGVGLHADQVPDPVWTAPVPVPGHVATVVLLRDEAGAGEAARRATP